MARVKRGTISAKSRRYRLAKVKGYRFGRSSKERMAIEAIYHAGNHAFAHRKTKKRNMRRLWTIRVNAALRMHGVSYSVFIGAMTKKGIKVNRKMLSEIAVVDPASFEAIVKEVMA